MHLPEHFKREDLADLHGVIRQQPLGTWVTPTNSDLVVNHIPFLIHSGGTYGTLVCHVARANPVWQAFSKQMESVVIFHGPQVYISPSWYPSKHEHGKAVPTWNYVVVHAYGSPRVIDDSDWLYAHLSELSEVHEAQQPQPWKVTDAPADYIQRMISSIVGVEIPITRLLGKWKTSQNRSEADRIGVSKGLLSKNDPLAADMAALVYAEPKSR